MTTFERSIQIAASPDVVWTCLTHPNYIKQWWTALREYNYASEKQSGVGMTFVIEEKIGMGPPLKIKFEISKWTKLDQIAFKMVSGTGAKTYDISWTLESIDNGTLFNYVEQLKLSNGFMDRVWGMLGRRSGMDHIADYLDNLKTLAETREAEIAQREAV